MHLHCFSHSCCFSCYPISIWFDLKHNLFEASVDCCIALSESHIFVALFLIASSQASRCPFLLEMSPLLRQFFSLSTSLAILIDPVNWQVLPLNHQCLPLNYQVIPLIVRSLLRGVSTSEVLPLNYQCLPLIPLSACHFWRSDPTI